jgi:hypothetical protein
MDDNPPVVDDRYYQYKFSVEYITSVMSTPLHHFHNDEELLFSRIDLYTPVL